MILITLNGADVYLAEEIEKGMLDNLSKIYKVHSNEILFHAVDGRLVHNGMDQTSYHLIVHIEADSKFIVLEKEIAKYILDYSSSYSVHAKVYFSYFDSSHLYERNDEDYDPYLTKSNSVEIQENNEQNEEIYDGNIFKEYEHMFPDEEKK